MEKYLKIGGLEYRMDNRAEKAECEKLIRGFCEEEERSNRSGLLVGGEKFSRSADGQSVSRSSVES